MFSMTMALRSRGLAATRGLEPGGQGAGDQVLGQVLVALVDAPATPISSI